MKMRLQYVALVLFVFSLASCTTESLEEENINIAVAENVKEVEADVLDIVNEHRVSLGYPSLVFSQVAYEYANTHTDYMISKGSLSHDNFSSRASKISSLADAEMVAENVAKDYDTAEEAFQGWLNSPNHKKTIEGQFTHTAVSVKKDNSGNFYFTQIFFR